MSVPVQRFLCMNRAAIVMEFRVKYADSQGNELDTGWKSGNYSIGMSRACELSALPHSIPEGAPVWIEVQAVLGKKEVSDKRRYVYTKNARSVSFEVKGSSLNFVIKEV